jgi:(p)ppGpp synthase/HD superfamily hydrolase
MNSRLLNALDFASIAHDGQKRKDGITPYIAHPFGVGIILLEHGYSDDTVIAGILHDVVEDTKFSLTDIQEKFGEKVSKIVSGVTEDKNISSRKERLEKYLLNLKNSDNDTRAVCVADMLHNRQSLIKELENKYDIWKALNTDKEKYLQMSYEKLRVVKETLNDNLVKELEKTLEKISEFSD